MALDLSTVDLPTEVVRTERLVLRPHREDDVDAITAACQDPDLQRWLTALPSPYTRDDAVTYVRDISTGGRARGTDLGCAIEADGELVGTCGVHSLTGGRLGPEIGYWIAPAARRRGYAAEAAHAVAEWALGLGAPRVHLYADVRNTASQAVARRAGFTQEGLVRGCLEYRDGTRGDAALFSRLPGD
ncbi:MAG TPA: GNAT family N-acetyltransferase [Blastococcus sp.]|jgi:RimJ/RimL family protein N-acetyltransferase|nr:GNAT family N-acetyltransferase [Blastococcus sp.]